MTVRARAHQDTDDASIDREIARLQPEIDQIVREIAEVDADLAAQMALPPHHFSAHDAAALQRLADNKRDTLKVLAVDRVAMLEARRATPEQKAEADTQARAQIERVEKIAAIFDAKFAELVKALDAAKVIARDVATLRTAGRTIKWQIADLVARHGLNVTVPSEPDASEPNQMVAALLTKFCEVAITDSPDDRIEVELASARTKAS